MAVEPPEIIRTYVGSFTASGLDAWVNTFRADGTYSSPIAAQPVPKEEIREHLAGLFAGFPDATFETVDLGAISEDLWVWHWIMHATNTGSYRGLPPTGRTVALPGCEFIGLRGGLVERVVGYFDRLTIVEQLGLSSPSPSSPAV